MKLKLLIALSAFCISSEIVQAQSQQKAEKDFLKELNEVLQKTENQHWEFDGKMTIDTPFKIHGGNLTSTVRYTTGNNVTHVRTEAPLNKITFASQDVYVYLEYRDKSVIVYEQVNNTDWHIKFKRNMLHLGMGDDNGKQADKVQQQFDKLRKFYPTVYN